MNPAILWNDQPVQKALDTCYLVRNVNLPLTDEFIAKHLKTSHFVENNNYLTPELKDKPTRLTVRRRQPIYRDRHRVYFSDG